MCALHLAAFLTLSRFSFTKSHKLYSVFALWCWTSCPRTLSSRRCLTWWLSLRTGVFYLVVKIILSKFFIFMVRCREDTDSIFSWVLLCFFRCHVCELIQVHTRWLLTPSSPFYVKLTEVYLLTEGIINYKLQIMLRCFKDTVWRSKLDSMSGEVI